jgi:hypothetical protein
MNEILNVDPQNNVTLNGNPYPPMAFISPTLQEHKPTYAKAQLMPLAWTMDGVSINPPMSFLVTLPDGTRQAMTQDQLTAEYGTVSTWTGNFPTSA